MMQLLQMVNEAKGFLILDPWCYPYGSLIVEFQFDASDISFSSLNDGWEGAI